MLRFLLREITVSQPYFTARNLTLSASLLERRRGNRFENQSDDNQNPELEIFRQQKALERDQISNIHLNPAVHFDTLKKSRKGIPCPKNSRILRVNILGVPNSGKSTLINQLTGFNICAHSPKVHTTRRNARAILTENDTQVVFLDTPGLVTKEVAVKFNLEESLLVDPVAACQGSDLVILVQDVSNRFVRESIDKNILKVLCYNFSTPCILVLNKLDTIPKSRRVYDLIRKLTCGHLSGIKQKIGVAKLAENYTVDSYLKRKKKEEEELLKRGGAVADGNAVIIKSYEDFTQVLTQNKITDTLVTELTRGLVGWPNFKEVFTVSALKGEGVADLKAFLLKSAYPAPWDFPQELYTDQDPRETVKQIIKSKFLEVLPSDVPYKISPVIQTWSMDNGVLRLGITVDSNTSRSTSLLLGNNAVNLSKVAKLSEIDLMNFFQCEVFIIISVEVNHGQKSFKICKDQSPDVLFL